jgi:hypothetical protein
LYRSTGGLDDAVGGHLAGSELGSELRDRLAGNAQRHNLGQVAGRGVNRSAERLSFGLGS